MVQQISVEDLFKLGSVLGLEKKREMNQVKCRVLKELTALGILASERTVHSAKCYVERDIGALGKPDRHVH